MFQTNDQGLREWLIYHIICFSARVQAYITLHEAGKPHNFHKSEILAYIFSTAGNQLITYNIYVVLIFNK